MNSGRIQAQGEGTQKSAAWTTNNDFTKAMGLERVDNLEIQLTPVEHRLRVKALQQARNRINDCSSFGLTALSKKSFYDDFRRKKIRVDVDVLRGVGFID